MANFYSSSTDEQLAQISKKFSSYTRYYSEGDDSPAEYIDNCEVLLQNILNCAKHRIEEFVTDSSVSLPEFDLQSYQSMYEKIEDSIINASSENNL